MRLTSVKVNDKGAGRADNGNFVVNEVLAKLLLPDGKSQPVKFTAVATFSQNNFGVDKAIDGSSDNKTGWAVSPKINQDNVALATEPIDIPEGESRSPSFRFTANDTLGGLRLELSESESPATFDSVPSNVIAALAVPVGERSEAQAKAVSDWFSGRFDEQAKALRAKVAEHAKRAPTPAQMPRSSPSNPTNAKHTST